MGIPWCCGALGNVLLAALLGKDWVRRVDGGRALRVTAAGEHGLRALFGIEAAELLESRAGAESAAAVRRAAFR